MLQIKSPASPFYTKLAMILVSIIAVGYLAILGKQLLAPLIFAVLFSILLLPLARFFEQKTKLARSGAAFLSVLVFVVCIALILYLVGAQLTRLGQDWPLFKDQVVSSVNNLQHWVASTFHINMRDQMHYVNDATNKLISTSTLVLGTTVLSVSSIVLFLVFIMIYTFFLLFYRRLLVKFLLGVFKEDNAVMVYDVIAHVQYIIRKYIAGLLLEMAIVATACCLIFWILGIKYAILLGLITGLFNIIPYIGIFSALLLSTLITFATGAVASKIILVAITIIVIHLIDSNFLLPVIVGSKVRINALITVMGVIVGEMMWGISGMFLAIPVIAIMKIIFDRIEPLKPWGLLLGDEKNEKEPPDLKEKIKEEGVEAVVEKPQT
ncbi:AI-2E family transporter [Danxiaibacter flavus]|uniref:AI-2E family transporter n=1 Tax=Danxiaibacter flavus TaxID=3049108 RepID=A0ABV3Z7U6_9BACT|nr:AI-2E family transporter [Chitinophagaceae bacterium DXS]